MRLSIFGLLAILILAFTSCSKSDSKVKDLGSDDALILAIQKASNKQNIAISDLPSASKSIIETEYIDDYIDAAKLAPELGYEVYMRCKNGPRVGEQSQVYFSLDGRKLQAKNGNWQGESDKGDGDKGDKPKKDCFAFVLPVSFEMADGTKITIEEKEDWELIKTWYETHPEVKKRPSIEFPVDVIFKDGTTATLSNEVDMRRAMDSCKGEEDKDDKGRCFELVLPVTFTMPDGTEITIETKEDHALIKAWYEAHPDVKEKPAIQFPVDIIYKDGETKTINNEEEMHLAKKACNEDKEDKRRCFKLVLPITYTMADDTEITIEEKEDWQLIKAWYEAHPDVKERPELQFPVDIEWKNGTIETISSKEEMKEAKEECEEKNDQKKRCFELVLPVTYIMPDGMEIVLENKEDRQLIKDWYIAHPDVKERPELQFPVEIKWKDGTIKTINNIEEMKKAKEACEGEDKP